MNVTEPLHERDAEWAAEAEQFDCEMNCHRLELFVGLVLKLAPQRAVLRPHS